MPKAIKKPKKKKPLIPPPTRAEFRTNAGGGKEGPKGPWTQASTDAYHKAMKKWAKENPMEGPVPKKKKKKKK